MTSWRRLFGRQAPSPSGALRRFFFPRLTGFYLLRVVLVGLVAFVFFRYVCTPAWTHGQSMDPTYSTGEFVLCWRLRYVFRAPRIGDVVLVRLAGPKVMYLKRIVALGGDSVAFEAGQLVRNGRRVEEPYVSGACSWELPVRTVEAGHVYVIGDNRRMPMGAHRFGQVSIDRLEGGPLW